MSWGDETRNVSELIFSTVRRAIDEGGRGMTGITSVVLAAHDLVDGRSLSSMVTAPAAGAYLRDEIRYGDDGAAAFAAAVVRIEAGETERSIVAAWGRASEHDVDTVSRALFDPFFGSPLGMEELHVSGMRAQSWIQAGGRCGDRVAAGHSGVSASGAEGAGCVWGSAGRAEAARSPGLTRRQPHLTGLCGPVHRRSTGRCRLQRPHRERRVPCPAEPQARKRAFEFPIHGSGSSVLSEAT